jgi:hypothetical protein
VGRDALLGQQARDAALLFPRHLCSAVAFRSTNAARHVESASGRLSARGASLA